MTRKHFWQFDEHVSAAGWIDHDRLLIASETRLFSFNLATQAQQTVVALEAKDPRTRSNDGRADPWGGFWIGTMGKQAEAGLGGIYRYYQGTLRPLYSGDLDQQRDLFFARPQIRLFRRYRRTDDSAPAAVAR